MGPLLSVVHYDYFVFLFFCFCFFCLFVESRYVLLPMVVEQLKNEMKKTEEMRRCIDILNDILITLTRKDVVS